MNKLAFLLLLLLGSAAGAQNFGAQYYSGGGWVAVPTTATSNPTMAVIPIHLYCYSSGVSAWVPADSTCFGGGGVSGTVILPCNGTTDVTSMGQAALDGGGTVQFFSSSATNICVLSSSLIESSYTRLVLPPNLTMQEAADADFPLLINRAYANRATSGVAVTLSWTSGNSVSVAWTAHGLSVGQYVWIRNSTASTYTHYNGVFKVASVTDANDFVVNLDIIPPAAPPAGMVASVADVNESVEGGIWNYNGSAPLLCTGLQCNAITFGGVENVQIRNLIVNRAEKYSVHVGAARDVVVSDVEDWNTYSDAVKLLGPIHNARVLNIHGVNGDDQVTVQNDQGPRFPTYAWTEGDVSQVYANSISENDSANGTMFGLIACGSEYMGGITVDSISGITSASNGAVIMSTACTTGAIQTVTIRNAVPSGSAKGLYVDPEFYGGTGATLSVANLNFQGDLSNTLSVAPIQFAAGSTVTSANLQIAFNYSPPVNTMNLIQASCTTGNHCTINNLNILNSSIVSNFRARLVDIGPFATVGQLNLDKGYDNTGANLITAEATSIGTTQINITNSILANVAAVAACAINCNLALNNTTVNGASGGVLAATGSVTMSLKGTGNTYTGGTVTTHTSGGAPVFNYSTSDAFLGITYTAAGTPLPACAANTLSAIAQVGDATVSTPGSAYTSGGTFTVRVQCTFNSTGSVFAWQIM